jgi:hypothetical protein
MILPTFATFEEQLQFLNAHFSHSIYQLDILTFLINADLADVLFPHPENFNYPFSPVSNYFIFSHKLALATHFDDIRFLIILLNDPLFESYCGAPLELTESYALNYAEFSHFLDNEIQELPEASRKLIQHSFDLYLKSVDWDQDPETFIIFTTDLNELSEKLFANVFKNMESGSQPCGVGLEDLAYLDNLTNMTALYHYSVPNVKLAYPEPFIASASFMHSDLWFVHILTYQYWLWFIFTFLIVFFFLTFISVVR